MKPMRSMEVQPAQPDHVQGQNPTQTRYGWCPYKDINLTGPSGSPDLYVQPHVIDAGAGAVPNPYHRVLPKNHLIPFPTFPVIVQTPSDDLRDKNGRAVLIESAITMTALDAAVMVLRGYSFWGFTIARSLQGLDQADAFRIFQVVQPFDYLLAALPFELTDGAADRISATTLIEFEGVDGFSVQPLRSDAEREIATALAAELLVGAEIALTLATGIMDETVVSMTSAHSGGMGKKGPDDLDRYLSRELCRELPQLLNPTQPAAVSAELGGKIDFLFDRAVSQEQREEIEKLRAENDLLKRGIGTPPSPAAETVVLCRALRADSTPCRNVVKNEGDLCPRHTE